jgi:hypothetical protein
MRRTGELVRPPAQLFDALDEVGFNLLLKHDV